MQDMLSRELAVGDFVVYYSNLYEVKSLGRPGHSGTGSVRIMIYPPSKTSRPVLKHSSEMVRVPAEDVTLHLLKQGRL
jgi:hypothetical protein